MSAIAYQYDNGNNINAHKQIELFEIAYQMKEAALPEEFIVLAIRTGLEFEGVADLIKMWATENDQKERDEIIADIQDLINDCQQHNQEEFTYIKFNDLEKIAHHIREFKDRLLQIVMEKGGIKKLSESTQIPQPSLSRFFNSSSMPHRATLLKIAKALNLDGIQIATPWTK